VTEICDVQTGLELVTEDFCEILIIHFKLFKGSDRHQDIHNILEEADQKRREKNRVTLYRFDQKKSMLQR
jgi:hypothetical protein